jgi:hypothetical protein
LEDNQGEDDMEEGENKEAWRTLREGILVLEEEGIWTVEEDRMNKENEAVGNEAEVSVGGEREDD